MTDPAPQTLTRKEREFKRHRQTILDAAESLFAEQGFHTTTMQMVADAAEFSVGYLYKHFDGKDDLYRAMITGHLGRFEEIITEVSAQGLSPLATLKQSFRETSRHMNRHRDFMRIFHESIDAFSEELLEGKKRHFRQIADKLEEARGAGEIRDCDIELLAAALQGATKELFGVLANRDGENPFDDLTDLLFSLLIDPLRI